MAQKTIPQLTEATSIDENAIFPFDTGTETKKITGANLAVSLAGLTPSSKFISKWLSTVTYAEGDMVYSGKDVYVSLQGSNLNKAVTNPAYWEKSFKGGLNPQVNEVLAARALSTWTGVDISPGAADILIGVAWSPELSLYAACVYTNLGTYTSAIWTSADGKSWTNQTTPNFQASSIIWSPEWGMFVAVGSYPSDDTVGVITSPDGETWTNRTPAGTGAEWSEVKYSKENGRAIAIDFSAIGDYEMMYSDNGTSWTEVESLPDTSWSALEFCPSLDLWIALGSGSTTKGMKSSDNGETWEAMTTAPSFAGDGLAWSDEKGIAVCVAEDSCAISRDGDVWDSVTIPSGTWFGVKYIKELGAFVAFGGSGSLAISFDGITWISKTSGVSGIIHDLSFSVKTGIAVCVVSGDSGSSEFIYSKYVQNFVG